MTEAWGAPSNMATRSAFMRLATTNPDPDTVAQSLVRGPMSAYGAIAATIYVPDDGGDALRLIGQWGFGPSLSHYAAIPLSVDFPLVRSYLTGEALVVPGSAASGNVLSDTALTSVLADVGRRPDEVTVIAMPFQYRGIPIGAGVWLCTHPGPWTWHDYAYFDGTSAVVSLWLQLRTYEASLQAAGVGAQRLTTGRQLLTERQREVLALIRDGKSNAAIAAALGYSISTVKNDVQALLTVFGAARRKELVRRAVLAGVLTEASDAGP